MLWPTRVIVGLAAAVSLCFVVRKRATVRRLMRQGSRARHVDRAAVRVGDSHVCILPRLVFPMVSLLPGTGRSMWLAMLHRLNNMGDSPHNLHLQHLPDRKHEDLDAAIDTVLSRSARKHDWYVGPYAYETLVVSEDRCGRLACSAVLQQHSFTDKRELTPEDALRFGSQSLVACHGVLMFLDPSRASEADLSLVLDRFDACVSALNSTRSKTHVPVAICVTKIDLLKSPSRQEMEGDWPVDSFYSELAEIAWGHDLPSIRRRSELTQKLCGSIWPEWEIEPQTEKAFGARPMFFPMTSVGLYGLGEDLANRVISPVGILHPLLWLLHMNGYMTLPSRTEQ